MIIGGGIPRRARAGARRLFAYPEMPEMARELIAATVEVSESIIRRAEAGETISQEEVKTAVRIGRVDCAPVTLPRPPTIELVRLSRPTKNRR